MLTYGVFIFDTKIEFSHKIPYQNMMLKIE